MNSFVGYRYARLISLHKLLHFNIQLQFEMPPHIKKQFYRTLPNVLFSLIQPFRMFKIRDNDKKQENYIDVASTHHDAILGCVGPSSK